MTFDDLNLNKALLTSLDDLGYTTPTTIQHKIFSVITSGRDVCGIAQTGTGKTLAYLLPALRMWKYTNEVFPDILIIVPTRELVVQVVEEIKKLTTYMNFRVTGVYGGVNLKPQAAEVEQGCDAVVATPGRLLDLVLNGSLRLKSIKKLVIDEVDEMLNLGFRTQLKNILNVLPAKHQSIMLSATITEEVEQLIGEYFNAPVWVEAAPTGTPLENIGQSVYHVPNFHTKVNLLRLLLAQNADMSKVLVFVASKSLADDLFTEIEGEFPNQTGVIHSNKSQNHRFNTVNEFKAGNYRFIIATDIIARGIDIAEVTHVINFDTPEEPEAYMHRIGRTGRYDKRGIAITFTTQKEMENLVRIEALMNYTIPVTPLPAGLPISDILTDDEQPKVRMKEVLIKLPDIHEGGGAFHEKLEKNKKVNIKIKHSEKMMQKYGKPLTRGPKKKKR